MGVYYPFSFAGWTAYNQLLVQIDVLYQVHAEAFTDEAPAVPSMGPTVQEQASGIVSPDGIWRASIPGEDNEQGRTTPWLVLENVTTGEVFQFPMPVETRGVSGIAWRPMPR
jgi:hypothetical protein